MDTFESSEDFPLYRGFTVYRQKKTTRMGMIMKSYGTALTSVRYFMIQDICAWTMKLMRKWINTSAKFRKLYCDYTRTMFCIKFSQWYKKVSIKPRIFPENFSVTYLAQQSFKQNFFGYICRNTLVSFVNILISISFVNIEKAHEFV